jgi:hypothetical protein
MKLNPLKPSPWPQSHHDLIQHYYTQYDRQIASGEYQPFLYPWGTLGATVVIAYLLIPHQNRPWLKKCRFLAFAWIVCFAAYCLRYTKTKGMAPSFGVGLISAWSVAWVSAILVCNDAQTDFARIERAEGMFGGSRKEDEAQEEDQNKEDSGSSSAIERDENKSTPKSTKEDPIPSPPSSSASTGSSTSSATSAAQAGTGAPPRSHHLQKPSRSNSAETLPCNPRPVIARTPARSNRTPPARNC